MSKKHFDLYFNEIAKQYSDMLDAIKDLETAVSQNLVSPEKLDNMQNIVKPMKENYMRLSYVMYLLNKPNRKKKQEKYENQNKKNKKTYEELYLNTEKENNKSINGIKEMTKEIRGN